MIGLSSYQIWYRSLPNSEKNYGQIPEIEIQYISDLYSEKNTLKGRLIAELLVFLGNGGR